MNLSFNKKLSENYRSNSQIARVLTESWMEESMFCPRCGNPKIEHFPNNRPVADFYCPMCKCEYELKSKKGSLPKKITDGAYNTMIERITSNKNPDFFFMGYSMKFYAVQDLIFVPKYFFVPNIIEKRKPLSNKARRAGWTGCNILIEQIPQQGRIEIVKNGVFKDIPSIIERVNKGNLLHTQDISARGWLMDILNCINSLPNVEFTSKDMYSFEEFLQKKHPLNNNVKAKIRQQLQYLRDKGFIEFLGNGRYRKI